MAEPAFDPAALDFGTVTPEEFAALVRQLSAREIADLMRGELRERVLAEVFGRMERQFRPDHAGSLDAVIRWEVTGDPDVVYETAIVDGTCTVRQGRSALDPRVTLTMGDAEFLRLVSGNGSPVAMFMTRKLKVAGDIGLASGLTRLFDLPKG
ncbi:SCP2 sterol-binding domain-containing protein [Streptomyces marincola]|uniref:SCP2 sterol-binding domain-containing protein n=1 Tax=Streptomyces marincola TaxID=2878388 RepID=UPI001CF2F3FF|nr:SCP2 sterol-binding domain-containing protein [Streptomyces marincola]UCM91166.1 SCP2 sterol-binding domain-containing protein [Streptomyces marincola]